MYCWFVIVLGTTGTAFVHTNDLNKLQNVEAVIAIESKVIQFYDHTTECVEKLMCILAALPESERNQMLSTPLSLLIKIATDKGQDRDSLLYAEAKKLLAGYPNIEHILNAAANGHSVKDNNVCALMYSKCPYEPKELLDTIKDLGDITTLFSKNVFGKVIADAIEYNYTQVGMPQTERREKRSCDQEAMEVSCGTLGGICGMSAVGCALCAVFSFGTCLLACSTGVAGTCGSIGGACTVAGVACR
ncbi:Mytilin-1 [Mytilus coruscus]|uniref:Mytilin-1 n=1 Tax=Mytilus coruscus TaxID=42192 RepID=A0A6J8EXB9_MYTCO|nr:Mytilin-1 [Mytilus coruscus]